MVNNDSLEVGSRIRTIRQNLGLSMEEFANRIDSKARSGTVSNWETGKNLPNNERLAKIAELGNVTVNYLLTGQLGGIKGLKEEIESVKKDIINLNKRLKEAQSKYDSLKNKSLGMSDSDPKLDELENRLIELNAAILMLVNLRDNNVNILKKMEETRKNFESGEVFSISDRVNPDFQKNGTTQHQISEGLKAIPYLLNYESTMKIAEYADMLSKDEKNLFKPENKKK